VKLVEGGTTFVLKESGAKGSLKRLGGTEKERETAIAKETASFRRGRVLGEI